MEFYYAELIIKVLALICSAMLYGGACYAKNTDRHSFGEFKSDAKTVALVLLIAHAALLIL